MEELAGGTGCAFEFCGSALKEISMEGRLTICNMAIEGGARCGLIALMKLPMIIL